MLHRHEYKNLIWVDLESPTVAEMREVVNEFGIDQIVADELLSPTLRTHTERYDNYLYLVLHFPTLKHPKGAVVTPEQEVDFIVGRNFIITARYEELVTFVEFRKVFEVNATLKEDHFTDNPFDIFLMLAKRLYRTVDSEIDTVRETLECIENEIFEGHEKEMVVSLSKAGRDILNLKQALDPHQDVLSSLTELTAEFAGKEYVSRVRAIENRYYRAKKHITRIWQTLNELRETNNSLLTTKQNEVMKIFTILAFVTFPLSLIASIFGMNTVHVPFIGNPYDFWIVILIMGIATFFMFLFFRSKKWL
ncbi:MAG: magnesium transporter CorA family protein [Candidatus Pacebacteria bacterium]|nr:magnesium transporter CorA family protein [Candidatus Paceibacterota bacterium]